MDPTTYYVFVCGLHGVFTSPCISEPPPCCDPHHPVDSFFSTDFPSRARRCLLSNNRYAFLALTPKSMPLESPMMGTLKLVNGTYLKRSQTSSSWGLKGAIQEDWKVLELNLHTLYQHLEAHQPLALLETERYPLPSRYGYLRLHATSELAEQAIWNSLDAFMVLSGYCSFLLLHCNQPFDRFNGDM